MKNIKGVPLNYKQTQCGIYCIRNKINGKFYLGSSANCYHRIRSQHLCNLRCNRHSNPHLQAAWNQYGESAFEFFVAEECSKDELLLIEQIYLDNTHCVNREIGYNLNERADHTMLTVEQRKKISLSKLGKPRSKETRKKISEAGRKRKWTNEQREKFVKSNSGSNHWNFGGHKTEEQKKKISEANKIAIKKWWQLRKGGV